MPNALKFRTCIRIKRSFLFVLLLLQMPSLAGSAFADTVSRTLNVSGYDWQYSVVLPENQPGKLPLVIILHGAGGRGEVYLRAAHWTEKAQSEGFIAVAPTAPPVKPASRASFLFNPNVWNTTQRKDLGERTKIDDIAFFKALLTSLERDYPVDPKRIFLTGHSNGAGMTFRLAAALNSTFRAIAPVEGVQWQSEVSLEKKIPTLYILGTEDPLVPPAGGMRKTPWSQDLVPPTSQSIGTWATALGCDTKHDIVTNESGVEISRYCPTEKNLFLVYMLKGQGHGWPGGDALLSSRIMGPSISGFSATDTIWNFFKSHF